MNEVYTSDVIVLKTEPVIEYSKLQEISKDVVSRIAALELDKIVANEDTVKKLKDIRAALNKESAQYEASRKTIKQLVLAPYDLFEGQYKDLILNRFKDADIALKTKIDEVEGAMKAVKEAELKSYFDEVKEAYGIGFINYENVGLNVTLTASMKSLKEQILTFVQRIDSELQVIDADEYKDDILVVYRRTLNLTQSITQVKNDIKAKQELQSRRESLEQMKQREQTPAPTPTTSIEESELDEIMTITFTVTASRRKLRALKAFIQTNEIKVEK